MDLANGIGNFKSGIQSVIKPPEQLIVGYGGT